MARHPLEFSFTYEDISRITGLSSNNLQQHKRRGDIVPESLESLVLFCVRHGSAEFRHRALMYATERLLPEKFGKRSRPAKKAASKE